MISRPSAWPKALAPIAICVAHNATNWRGNVSSSSAAGHAGSTWWPSPSSTIPPTAPLGAVVVQRPPSGWTSSRPMRSLPGSAPTSSAYGRAGAGAITVSPTPGPLTASSSAAVSRTVRLTQSSTPRPTRRGRPRRSGPGRLEPDEPHADAGMRIDPPPSDAWANGTMPAATAAPHHRSIRPASGRGPTGCASGPTPAVRSSAGCPARGCSCARR